MMVTAFSNTALIVSSQNFYNLDAERLIELIFNFDNISNKEEFFHKIQMLYCSMLKGKNTFGQLYFLNLYLDIIKNILVKIVNKLEEDTGKKDIKQKKLYYKQMLDGFEMLNPNTFTNKKKFAINDINQKLEIAPNEIPILEICNYMDSANDHLISVRSNTNKLLEPFEFLERNIRKDKNCDKILAEYEKLKMLDSSALSCFDKVKELISTRLEQIKDKYEKMYSELLKDLIKGHMDYKLIIPPSDYKIFIKTSQDVEIDKQHIQDFFPCAEIDLLIYFIRSKYETLIMVKRFSQINNEEIDEMLNEEVYCNKSYDKKEILMEYFNIDYSVDTVIVLIFNIVRFSFWGKSCVNPIHLKIAKKYLDFGVFFLNKIKEKGCNSRTLDRYINFMDNVSHDFVEIIKKYEKVSAFSLTDINAILSEVSREHNELTVSIQYLTYRVLDAENSLELTKKEFHENKIDLDNKNIQEFERRINEFIDVEKCSNRMKTTIISRYVKNTINEIHNFFIDKDMNENFIQDSVETRNYALAEIQEVASKKIINCNV